MKNNIKKFASIIGHLILENCVSFVLASAACVAICEGVRLWMRSFFAEYYELIFFFLCVAFIAGYLIGTCKLFIEYYVKASKAYEKRKYLEQAEVTRFMHLHYPFKQTIYEIYIKGSILKEYYSNHAKEDEILKFCTPTCDEYHYMNIEEIANDRVRITLKDDIKKFLKRHPELLDCLK